MARVVPGGTDPAQRRVMTSSFYASKHARARALERIGFEPTADEWRDAALAILDSLNGTARALMLRRDFTTMREIWLVPIGHTSARVVWSPVSALIVTVLEGRRGGG